MRFVFHLACLLTLTAAACAANGATIGVGHVVQIGFREGHRCVLHPNGAVDCVSESPYLNGTLHKDATYRPVRMVAHGATQLAVAAFASCAIVGGALDCWDALPATGKKAAPPQRIIASGVTDVSVGDDHACAAVNGAALCWGADADGQVGHNDYQDDRLGTAQSAPWQVIAHGVTQVAAGGDRSCAIADGALWCWGRTGLASDPHFKDYPGDYPPLRVFAHGVSAVAAGAHHVCAIVSGALWCWGDNSHGQVGKSQGFVVTGVSVCAWRTCDVDHPVKVIAYGVTAVFASNDETCALSSGALLCWGYNWAGQIGIASDKQDVFNPTVAIPLGATFVALNSRRTCAVMKDGTLRCTLPCTKHGDALQCPAQPAFVAGDPNDTSGIEARLGVWRGSIGGATVMVCLQRSDTFQDSMYYYLRHRFSIALLAKDNSGATWNEAPPNQRAPDWTKPAAVWSLQAPVDDRMDGMWSAADGSRTAPIKLTRVAATGTRSGTGCDAGNGSPAGRAFNAPRVAAQELTVKNSGGFRYVSALNGHISVTELPASVPHAAQINAALRGGFEDNIAEYYDCAFNSFDGVPDYDDSSEIQLLAPPWLVTRENYSAFCGGAHPSSGTTYTVWNLDTGETVDPWKLIKTSHSTALDDDCDNAFDCEQRLPAKLRAILVARFKHDNAGDAVCTDVIDTDASFILHPEKNGLVFSTAFPHVVQACDEDISVPWKTLEPFLSAQGKAAMQSLHQGR